MSGAGPPGGCRVVSRRSGWRPSPAVKNASTSRPEASNDRHGAAAAPRARHTILLGPPDGPVGGVEEWVVADLAYIALLVAGAAVLVLVLRGLEKL